jgi:predicted metal-binding membrane protein
MVMSGAHAFSLTRDNAIVLVALGAIGVLAWLAVLAGAGTGMDPVAMSGWLPSTDLPPAMSGPWSLAYWIIVFFMWATMMVAMMLPSASPMVLLFGRIVRQAQSKGQAKHASASIAAFASGYLALWILFSFLAVGLQFWLERAGALSGLMSSRSALLSGALLIAAGLYQLTPLKNVCLEHCRGPAQFIVSHWRPGIVGAFRMGLGHGVYCLGCCAVLMLILFVGGVMNLVWIAPLTIFVAIERFTPFGSAAAKAMAAILVVGGLALVALGG